MFATESIGRSICNETLALLHNQISKVNPISFAPSPSAMNYEYIMNNPLIIHLSLTFKVVFLTLKLILILPHMHIVSNKSSVPS
jgi:hypothetical protein